MSGKKTHTHTHTTHYWRAAIYKSSAPNIYILSEVVYTTENILVTDNAGWFLYPGECVEPVPNKGRFGQTLNGHIGCTEQKSSRVGLWMKKIIALANGNVPKLKWNIQFYYNVELTRMNIFKFGHTRQLRMGS